MSREFATAGFVQSVRRARPAAAAAVAYLALTIAYTWPLPVRLTTGIIHDPYDPVLNTWILWWSTQAVPFTQAWWNAPMFLPAPGVLAFSEHLLGLAPLTAPLIALSGSPLFGYNVALLASYVLCALGAYFLAFTLTRRHDAAFVAGLAFAFAPYRLAQLPHIQVMASFWTPVCLAALHRYDKEASTKWAVAAAAAWYMQAMSNGYFFFFLSTLIALWLAWFVPGRWRLSQLGRLAAAFLVVLLLFAPVLLGYSHILTDTYGFHRGREAVAMYSADIASLLQANDELWLWGWLHVIRKPESELFPGPTLALLAALAVLAAKPFTRESDEPSARRWLRRSLGVLAAIALVAGLLPFFWGRAKLTIGGVRLLSIGRADTPLLLATIALLAWLSTMPAITAALRRRSALMFYGLAAFVTWVLALGPDPELFGRTGLTHAPYGWLMRLPGFDGLRVPARFWMMTLACLSAIAALAINRVAPRRRRALVVLASAGLLLDGWPRTMPVLSAPALRPSPAGVTSRLELPMTDDIDTQAIYRQMFDRVPIHNGYSGYVAPHYYALRTLIDEREPLILQELARQGPLGVVIDHAGDTDGALRRFVIAYPGAETVHSEAAWSSYRLPQSAGPPDSPDRTGTPLRIASLSTFPSPPHAGRALDGDLRTRWSGGPQQQSAEAIIDLGGPAHVGDVVIELGPYSTDFSRRLQADVSRDGRTWDNAWTGDTALRAYLGALRQPKHVPIAVPIDRDGIRFIRLRQVGFGPRDWSIAELHVFQ